MPKQNNNQLIPNNFVELFQPKKNNWGSTEGLDKPLSERYSFSRENQKIFLDIPYEVMSQLGLPKGENCPWTFYLDQAVLDRPEIDGGISIEDAKEVFLLKRLKMETESSEITIQKKQSKDDLINQLNQEVENLHFRVKDLEEKSQKNEEKKNINMGIVGFSYEVTDLPSKKPWITKREFGNKSLHKIELAHGYNWSDEYWWGYGHSHLYVADNGPFYSIVGGYTDYTSKDSKSPFIKSKEWGIESKIKFGISEGYDWNPFLNAEGYSRIYIYLLKHESLNNVFGGKIQSTSKDSSSQWIETNSFGKKAGKEIAWGCLCGWSEQHWLGTNHFSLYTDDSLLQQLEAKVEISPKTN